MGSFDLTCALSGLSTEWCFSLETGRRSNCSMMLLEQVEGRWLPLCPPVSGVHDTYGRIEVREGQATRALEHVDRRIDAMISDRLLPVGEASDLKHQRQSNLGSSACEYFAHAQSMSLNDKPLLTGKNPIATLFFVDEALTALYSHLAINQQNPVEELFLLDRADAGKRAACCDWLYEQGRTALADYLRLEGKRGTFGAFGPAHETLNLRPFHVVAAWLVEHRGGFKPLTFADTHQRLEEDSLEALRKLWLEGHPAISQLIERHDPALTTEWRKTAAPASAPAQVSRAGRAYKASERYAVGETISHPTFGLGTVQKVDVKKVHVLFGGETRTLVHAPR